MKSTSNPLAIPSIGFGTDGVQRREILDTAILTGYRLFDSADLYGNSDLLSDAIIESKIPREEFFINYKILPKLGKERFFRHVERAITKFGYLDCLMIHDMVASREEIAEILRSLQSYKESGIIRRVGLSNVIPAYINEFPNVDLVENKFTHLHQDEAVRALCKEKNIPYIGYSLFGGKAEGGCGGYHFNYHEPAWNLSNIVFPGFHELVKKYETTPYVMLIVWALLQNTIQIPTSSRRENMEANLSALTLISKVTEEDKEKLTASLVQKAQEKDSQLIFRLDDANWIQPEIRELMLKDDRLGILKMYVGNYASRHRVLEMVYREDSLKRLYDMVLNYEIQSNLLFIPATINKLTYFLEECLKAGEAEFLQAIEHLQTLATMGSSREERNGVIEIIEGLGDQKIFHSRYYGAMEYPMRYQAERAFIKENGYFKSREIELDGTGDTVGIAIDNKIYIIRNVAAKTTLKELNLILKKCYPDDFNGPGLNELVVDQFSHKIPLESRLYDTDFSSGDVFYIGQKKLDCDFSRFYHDVTKAPIAFTDPALSTSETMLSVTFSYQDLKDLRQETKNEKTSDFSPQLFSSTPKHKEEQGVDKTKGYTK